jgi:3-oxoacyl-[acyl-carrier protein] reductase
MSSNLISFTDKRILVTGASSGIGRETAILLSQLGATLTLTGRDPERLGQTLDALQGTGHVAETFDLSNLEEVPRWMKQLAQRDGPFSGLVHSAGLHKAMPASMASPQLFDTLMRVNVYSGAMLAKGFRQRDCRVTTGGSIVLLSSVAGLVGEPGISAYSASKAAINGMTRSLAVELAREKIRVNAIAPGFVQTEMSDKLRESLTDEQFAAIEAQHPLGIGRAIDIANGAAFLLSDASAWTTGSVMVIDGGYTAH